MKTKKNALLGAIFLMATSAIGPGFLTQTANFTQTLGAAFAFAIVISILIDIAVQLNVWRIIGISGLRAQELGNKLLPGLGMLLTVLICIGGLVFNIGNIAGGGLGFNAMLGLDTKIGGLITAFVAIFFFTSARLGVALDKLLILLGVVMIALTLYVCIQAQPPIGDALKNTVLPEKIDSLAIVTLVGGTVGGYITYAGAHKMLDSGETDVSQITKSSINGILLTGLMRILLFLAVLGVVAGGTSLVGEANPAAAAFRAAAGDIGYRFFGVVLWAAALSSVIGASYTSASFLTKPENKKAQNIITIVFILISCSVFLINGTAPRDLLVFAGAFNGLVLPIGFSILLFIAMFKSKTFLKGQKYPLWMILIGLVALVASWFLAWQSFDGVFKLLNL